ncbi:MAG: amino acid racemase [Chloroflexi bacterium]|nr:amino acid racemase [Chloroflexota bacterium]MBE3114537.1 amino acid racemase [Actinomycetota bacterium]
MKYKILGLIGGIGPESTIDYYKMIVSRFRERIETDDYPKFLINNINITEMLSYVKTNQLDKLVDFLAFEIKKVQAGGADFAVLASNTPHIVFDELRNRVDLPMISIVDETFKVISKDKLRKVALFGTMFTMQAGFYQKVGVEYSIDVLTPDKISKIAPTVGRKTQ